MQRLGHDVCLTPKSWSFSFSMPPPLMWLCLGSQAGGVNSAAIGHVRGCYKRSLVSSRAQIDLHEVG